jgi:integrase
MAKWVATGTAGVYVAHRARCPAKEDPAKRCRCEPSYRGRRWNTARQAPENGPIFKEKSAVIRWLGGERTAGEVVREGRRDKRRHGPLLEEIAQPWIDGVKTGTIGRRRGTGKPYSATTVPGYERSLRYELLPEYGPQHAALIDGEEWQRWVDRLAREGKSRSRIANHLAVVRAIYKWAAHPTRRLVPCDPTRLVELPPNDAQPRLRIASVEEAEQLLAALEPEDQVPYAVAFYAGLRRGEIDRLDIEDLFLDANELLVRESKSDAGSGRRPPIPKRLVTILRETQLRQGRPKRARACGEVSVYSGRLAKRAMQAWGWGRDKRTGEWRKSRDDALTPITLHECRHTYASWLMASRYTLSEIMEFMGHSDLQTTDRYVKLLPQPRERNRAERLNRWLDDAVEAGPSS